MPFTFYAAVLALLPSCRPAACVRKARLALIALVAMLLCPAAGLLAQTATSGGNSTFASGFNYIAVDVATDANGNVYVSTTSGTYMYSPTGVATQIDQAFAGPDIFNGQRHGLAVGPDGNVYVGIGSNIDRLGPSGTLTTVASVSAAGKIRSIACDSKGNFYAATDNYDGIVIITKVAPNGTLTNVPLASEPGYSISYLTAVAVDSSDNLYYTMGDETSIAVGYVVEVNKDGSHTKFFDDLYGPVAFAAWHRTGGTEAHGKAKAT